MPVEISALILPAMTSRTGRRHHLPPGLTPPSPASVTAGSCAKGSTVSTQLLSCRFPALREVKRTLPRRAIFTKKTPLGSMRQPPKLSVRAQNPKMSSRGSQAAEGVRGDRGRQSVSAAGPEQCLMKTTASAGTLQL